MKLGFEGACSAHVTHYDELGLKHYAKIAAQNIAGPVRKEGNRPRV